MTRLTVPDLLNCTLLIYSQYYGKLFIYFCSTSVLIQFRFHSSCLYHEKVCKNPNLSSSKLCFIFIMSSLCKNARNLEKNQIVTIKIMHAFCKRFVDEYREFQFRLFLMFLMYLFSDTKCMEIILV